MLLPVRALVYFALVLPALSLSIPQQHDPLSPHRDTASFIQTDSSSFAAIRERSVLRGLQATSAPNAKSAKAPAAKQKPFELTKADIDAFLRNPPPPPAAWKPAFVPKPGAPAHRWNAEDDLMYTRFLTCFVRKNVPPRETKIRESMLRFRDEVIKVIPDLSFGLSDGLAQLLSTSPKLTKQLVWRYQARRRDLRAQHDYVEKQDSKIPEKVWKNDAIERDRPNSTGILEDYLNSPDQFGDNVWEYWCPSSHPCTADELCLLSHLTMMYVVGEHGLNANPNADGEQVDPNARVVGPFIGQAYRPRKHFSTLSDEPDFTDAESSSDAWEDGEKKRLKELRKAMSHSKVLNVMNRHKGSGKKSAASKQRQGGGKGTGKSRSQRPSKKTRVLPRGEIEEDEEEKQRQLEEEKERDKPQTTKSGVKQPKTEQEKYVMADKLAKLMAAVNKPKAPPSNREIIR